MAQVDAILFDKDGTLFDFEATWGGWTRRMILSEAGDDAARAGAMAEALGYDLDAGRFAPDSVVIAGTVEELSAALLPHMPGVGQAELITRMNMAAAEAPQVEVTPLIPFLLELSARQMDLGVATNDSEAPARAHLRAAGVENMFDFIAGYDSGYGGKPAPGQLEAFARQGGHAPERCAMVGDSLHDLHAARAAGFVAIGVLTGLATRADLAPAADVVLGSIAELPAWLDSRI